MRHVRWFVLIAVLVQVVNGCGSSPPPLDQTSAPSTEPETGVPVPPEGVEEERGCPREHGGRCLPVVSGCGCAYVCGESIRCNPDGTYEIVHDFLDSATVSASVERWCFDAAGHGSPEAREGEVASAACLEVFFDGTPCGGECIPTTEFSRCGVVEGRCAALRQAP